MNSPNPSGQNHSDHNKNHSFQPLQLALIGDPENDNEKDKTGERNADQMVSSVHLRDWCLLASGCFFPHLPGQDNSIDEKDCTQKNKEEIVRIPEPDQRPPDSETESDIKGGD